jgi:adenylate cyclase
VAGGDHAEAASWGRRAMTLNPRSSATWHFLAASLAASGQFKEAREVGRALLRVNPTFSAAAFAAGHAFKDADKRRLFGEHLVLAGLPA